MEQTTVPAPDLTSPADSELLSSVPAQLREEQVPTPLSARLEQLAERHLQDEPAQRAVVVRLDAQAVHQTELLAQVAAARDDLDALRADVDALRQEVAAATTRAGADVAAAIDRMSAELRGHVELRVAGAAAETEGVIKAALEGLQATVLEHVESAALGLTRVIASR